MGSGSGLAGCGGASRLGVGLRVVAHKLIIMIIDCQLKKKIN